MGWCLGWRLSSEQRLVSRRQRNADTFSLLDFLSLTLLDFTFFVTLFGSFLKVHLFCPVCPVLNITLVNSRHFRTKAPFLFGLLAEDQSWTWSSSTFCSCFILRPTFILWIPAKNVESRISYFNAKRSAAAAAGPKLQTLTFYFITYNK